MDLGQAFAAARRHWILLLVLTFLGLSAGVANQLLTDPTYRSTSTVLFSLNRTGTISELADGNSYVQDLVPSYVKVARMPIVLAPVISDLGLDTTPAQLAEKITVTVEPASVVAQISAVDTDRDMASDIANKVAERLVQALNTLSPTSTANSAVIDVTTLSPASPSSFPVSPNRNQNLGGGLFAGLLFGIIAVALRESIVTQPLTTRAEIEKVTDTPVIGSIVADPRAGNRPLPVSSHPTIARSESFRILQTTLGGLRGDGPQCLVVISSLPGEGRSQVAVNLAIAMAHASRNVLLIDADLRKPAIATLVGIENTRGLTSVLNAASTLEKSIQTWQTQPWGDKTLDVLPAGPTVANPSELIASRAMTWVLEEVRKDYDVVVVDSPPLLQSTDGALLSAQLDYAVMIVDAPRTKQRHLVESLSRLRMAGADVLGLVLNRTTPSSQLEYPAVQPSAVRGGEAAQRHTAGHASGRAPSAEPGSGKPAPVAAPAEAPAPAGPKKNTPAFTSPVPNPVLSKRPFFESPTARPGGTPPRKPGSPLAEPPKPPAAQDKPLATSPAEGKNPTKEPAQEPPPSPRQPQPQSKPAQAKPREPRKGEPPPTVQLPARRPPG